MGLKFTCTWEWQHTMLYKSQFNELTRSFSWKCVLIAQSTKQWKRKGKLRRLGKGFTNSWGPHFPELTQSDKVTVHSIRDTKVKLTRTPALHSCPSGKYDSQQVKLARCAPSSIQNRKYWNRLLYRMQTCKIVNWAEEEGRNLRNHLFCVSHQKRWEGRHFVRLYIHDRNTSE